MHIIHISTLVFRFLSLLTFTSIFIYWSITAIIKYKSGKTVSSVSYRFGDDGHGNINFPAITICLGAQSFTSLKIDLHQEDINEDFAVQNLHLLLFSFCVNVPMSKRSKSFKEMFHLRYLI